MGELTFWAYIVTNARNGTLYIGHTDDIHARMEQHIDGAFKGFTSRYGLKHLVWYEEFDTRDEAFIRERRMKEWKRAWKLRLIEEINPMWLDLHTVPMWPLPDADIYPDLYTQCLQHKLDPGLRRGERRKKS